MRPLLHGDLIVAARALERVEPERREAAVRRWLLEAHAADRFRKRLGRIHPFWGNGSLLARVLVEPRASDGAIGESYLRALAIVGQVAAERRPRR